jgi:hypothetical protein
MYALVWELVLLVFDSFVMSLFCTALFPYTSTHDGDQFWDHLNDNTM